jgi:hypothetical protein
MLMRAERLPKEKRDFAVEGITYGDPFTGNPGQRKTLMPFPKALVFCFITAFKSELLTPL